MMKIGDIIRFDVFRWGDDPEENQSCPPIWGRVCHIDRRPDRDGGEFNHLCGGAPVGFLDTGSLDGLCFFSSCDRWEIVPENEVPSEVWAEIAKRALLGAENE